jgi:polar amino acid transport system substrate-binding protein
MKKLRTIALLVCIVLGVAGCGSSSASKPYATIRIGLSPDNPPMEFANASNPSAYEGFDIDMIKAVMAHLGRSYQIESYQFSGLVPALQAGHIDTIISDMWVNSARSKVVDFVSYQQARQSLFTVAGDPLRLTSPMALCGHNVAAKLGTVGQQWLDTQSTACTNAGKAAINVTTYPDLPTGVLSLDNGRVDAIFEDALSTSYLVKESPGKYAITFTTSEGIIVAAAVNKGNSTLAKLLEQGISWFQSSGKSAQVFAKWDIPTSLAYPCKIITN